MEADRKKLMDMEKEELADLIVCMAECQDAAARNAGVPEKESARFSELRKAYRKQQESYQCDPSRYVIYSCRNVADDADLGRMLEECADACGMAGINEDDLVRMAYVSNSQWLYDEKMNLSAAELTESGGILVIGRLGLWNRTQICAKIIDSDGGLPDIFDTACGEEYEFYAENSDIWCSDTHHDGTNTYLFREIREGHQDKINRLWDLLYAGKWIDHPEVCLLVEKHTKSLYGYAARVYGWPDIQPERKDA